MQDRREKLTMVGMKFSLIMMERICFQSVVLSPRSRQMDSRASLTAPGGLAMERTSTRCCFLMDLTANPGQRRGGGGGGGWHKRTEGRINSKEGKREEKQRS
uniref:Uncharacterized protein n=1 Tax=Oncorhynchus kisutch TaxID=8019 RepID=A0A8C7M220_ONCKI